MNRQTRALIAAVLANGCGGKIATLSTPGQAEDASGAVPVVVTAARVTPWYGGANAAYSLIHDDFCAGADGIQSHSVPELRARNLRGGFATVVGNCAAVGLVATLKALASEGFEIVNHSYSHPHVTPDLAQHEIVESKALLESYTGKPVTFFAFPYDEFSDATIAFVAAAGYLGARAGSRGVNPPDFPDPFRIDFDVYGQYSGYGTGPESLDRYVDEAVASGGWAVRECHGVADASWEPVPLDAYRAHLDHIKSLADAGKLWVAPPSTVLRYRKARDACGAPAIAADRVTSAASSDCQASGSALTVALTVSGVHASLTARCGTSETPVRQSASGQWLVELEPGTTCQIVEH